MEIRPVLTHELPALRLVFREYAASIGNAICFQSFDAEVNGLPGAYAPPAGAILVAVSPTISQAAPPFALLVPGPVK
jgi:hypothetical protein